MEGSVEPFPLLTTSADPVVDTTAARRRRKSSALGQDIRAGDTGAPALASSRQSLSAVDRPSPSPSISSASSSNNTAMTSSSPAEPSAQTAARRISKRRRARGLLARARQAMIKRTYLLPAVILTIFGFLYALNPTESNPVHRFIFLSYRLDHASDHPLAPTDPDTPVQYGKGPRDIAFVAFYTVVLSFTREYIMQELIRPLARRAGLRSRAKQARFMEQMYTAVYFFFLGPAGMYELVGHHIVSLALIALSYRFHFTYIGLAVYITHDISDLFLATSKLLNYIDHPLTGPYFAVFMFVWIYLRHYINLRIIWSLLTEFQTIGPFELNWATEQYKCRISQVITLGLLSFLQALNLFWLFFIIRIAYRFLRDSKATDDRSEDEDDELEELDEDEKKKLIEDDKKARAENKVNEKTAANGASR
ncbi:hypothetical protein BN1708_003960 [Verticillium longisporum]|uniref:TLC domain-containing protein n=1 Tax=Verticillium longisporum TaxID=100787 RepID=A0A0G4LTS9_VERLO|nr:hypothetical protein BN1708_003960 [Verticillium longisporum]